MRNVLVQKKQNGFLLIVDFERNESSMATPRSLQKEYVFESIGKLHKFMKDYFDDPVLDLIDKSKEL